MAGDPQQKFSTGTPVRPGQGPLNAAHHNLTVDANRDYLRRRTLMSAPPVDGRDPLEIWAGNLSANLLPVFSIVGLAGLGVTPDQSLPVFLQETTFYTQDPSPAAPFAVTLDTMLPVREFVATSAGPLAQPPGAGWTALTLPLPTVTPWSGGPTYAIAAQVTDAGSTWSALSINTNMQPSLNPSIWGTVGPYIAGQTYAVGDVAQLPFLAKIATFGTVKCQVTVMSATDTYASPSAGNYASLESVSSGGAARILWREGGNGLQWAIITFCCAESSSPVVIENTLIVITGLGSLLLTGYPPTLGVTIVQGLGNLVLTGYPPGLLNLIPIPLGAPLLLTGLAPAIPNTLLMPLGAPLLITGLAPGIQNIIPVPLGAPLLLKGLAPGVGNKIVPVPLGAPLLLTGLAPKLTTTIKIPLGSPLQLTGYGPLMAPLVTPSTQPIGVPMFSLLNHGAPINPPFGLNVFINGSGFNPMFGGTLNTATLSSGSATVSGNGNQLLLNFTSQPTPGPLYAVVNSYGAPSPSVQIGVVVAPTITPSTANVLPNVTSLTLAGTNFDVTLPHATHIGVQIPAFGSVPALSALSATSATVTLPGSGGYQPFPIGPLYAMLYTYGAQVGPIQVATVVAPTPAPTVTLSTTNVTSATGNFTFAGTNFDPTLANNTVTLTDTGGALTYTLVSCTTTSITINFNVAPPVGVVSAVVATPLGGQSGTPPGTAVEIGNFVSGGGSTWIVQFGVFSSAPTWTSSVNVATAATVFSNALTLLHGGNSTGALAYTTSTTSASIVTISFTVGNTGTADALLFLTQYDSTGPNGAYTCQMLGDDGFGSVYYQQGTVAGGAATQGSFSTQPMSAGAHVLVIDLATGAVTLDGSAAAYSVPTGSPYGVAVGIVNVAGGTPDATNTIDSVIIT
jgi:hypothetical protein